jgi:hypothetical protein
MRTSQEEKVDVNPVIIRNVRPACQGGLFLIEFLTMESFSRQFQLNKEEREAVAWGWNREGGDTMFHVVNAYTRGAQFEGLSAASGYRLQKVGGMILKGTIIAINLN